MTEKPLDDLSSKMQVYLAKVYRLADFEPNTSDYVSTSALADALFVTAPAVNRMVNRLKESGLLDHEPYKGIRLTTKGRVDALKYLHAQRIVEVFLVKVMGLDWAYVHEEATKIASSVGETIVQRMSDMAGTPTHCPHGEPIPTPDGNIPPIDDIWLSHAKAGTRVCVTRFRTRDSDRLKYIEALGLVPNTPLDVLHIAPFNGPMQLKVGQEYRIIGSNLADLIRVKTV